MDAGVRSTDWAVAVTLDNPTAASSAASIDPSIEAPEVAGTSHSRSTYVWLTARVQKSLRSPRSTESVLIVVRASVLLVGPWLMSSPSNYDFSATPDSSTASDSRTPDASIPVSGWHPRYSKNCSSAVATVTSWYSRSDAAGPMVDR